MTVRYWQVGGLTTKEELDRFPGWNVFWYCFQCADVYARAWTHDFGAPWKALNGCCRRCEGSKWSIPGSLENVMFVDWKVPIEIAQYQLECELRFLRHPDHPYNEKE